MVLMNPRTCYINGIFLTTLKALLNALPHRDNCTYFFLTVKNKVHFLLVDRFVNRSKPFPQILTVTREMLTSKLYRAK